MRTGEVSRAIALEAVGPSAVLLRKMMRRRELGVRAMMMISREGGKAALITRMMMRRRLLQVQPPLPLLLRQSDGEQSLRRVPTPCANRLAQLLEQAEGEEEAPSSPSPLPSSFLPMPWEW